MQLQETAKAILMDDKAAGIYRSDPFLERLASGGPTHAAPRPDCVCLPPLGQARSAFQALDAASMRAKMKITRADLGDQKDYPFILPEDFVRALVARPKPSLWSFCVSRPKCDVH